MTKKNNYSYDIKLRAVMLRFQGKKYQEIQNILKIKHHKQIITWKKWYQAGQIYRFQTPIGYKYINNFLNYFFNEENEKIKLIKKNIKTQLAKNKKNYKLLYLKIIDKYKTKISLNKLLKWLNFNKSSYYRALNNINHPKPLTIVEKIIYQICYQNPIHPLLKNKLIFGYRKVHQLLKQQGYYLNPKTVLNKMRKLNLLCQTKKNTVKVKKKIKIYNVSNIETKPNLLNLDFYAIKPYQKLVTDITYLTQKLYLSAIMDLYNREIVAFQIAKKTDLKLVIRTIKQLPKIKKPCILHSDQGAQYINKRIVSFLKNKNIQSSFSPKASPTQNAPLESFWANLKIETFKMINQYLSQKEIIIIITNFIYHYNRFRPHQYLNYYSPQAFKFKNNF